jgi:hypothetical protein
MKKRKNPHKVENYTINNPVAKFAHQFNKSHAFCDKKAYRRKAKHVKQGVSLIVSFA